MIDGLNGALDRFDVPPMSAGLVDRIVAATAPPVATPLTQRRRDWRARGRRGMWRRGGQIVLGSMAIGLLSAGAVASGLLGRVGIEVPVLTAMLAPSPPPEAEAAPAPSRAPTRTARPATPPAVAEPPPIVTPLPLPVVERMALRQERRERIRTFANEHPVAAEVIRERVRLELQRRAAVRREALLAAKADATDADEPVLDQVEQDALWRAARRDRLVAERMIDRRIQARANRIAERQAREAVPVERAATVPTEPEVPPSQ